MGGNFVRTKFGKAVNIAASVLMVQSMIFVDIAQQSNAYAAELNLPAAQTILKVSADYSLPVLRGIKINPENPLELDFVIDTESKQEVTQDETAELIRYFLAGLAVPSDQIWVNLSPYESDRVIEESLEQTELGEQMLAQDYMLKQLSSSLLAPETEIGKAYWNATAGKNDAYNKIWIMPAKAEVLEHETVAYVKEANLKVMLDSDYLAMIKNEVKDSGAAEQILRENLLPAVEKEVNEGKNFARLRQIYHSLVLSAWFKQKFQDSFFKYYINQENVNGIDLADDASKEKVFKAYVESFNKGVFNKVLKTTDPTTGVKVKRQYFSGGAVVDLDGKVPGKAVSGSSITEVQANGNHRHAKIDLSSSSVFLKKAVNEIPLYEENKYVYAGDVVGDAKIADPKPFMTPLDIKEAQKKMDTKATSDLVDKAVEEDKTVFIAMDGVGEIGTVNAIKVIDKLDEVAKENERREALGQEKLKVWINLATGNTTESWRQLLGNKEMMKAAHPQGKCLADYKDMISGFITLDNYMWEENVFEMLERGMTVDEIEAKTNLGSYDNEQKRHIISQLYDSMEEMQEALDNGEMDFIAPVAMTREEIERIEADFKKMKAENTDEASFAAAKKEYYETTLKDLMKDREIVYQAQMEEVYQGVKTGKYVAVNTVGGAGGGTPHYAFTETGKEAEITEEELAEHIEVEAVNGYIKFKKFLVNNKDGGKDDITDLLNKWMATNGTKIPERLWNGPRMTEDVMREAGGAGLDLTLGTMFANHGHYTPGVDNKKFFIPYMSGREIISGKALFYNIAKDGIHNLLDEMKDRGENFTFKSQDEFLYELTKKIRLAQETPFAFLTRTNGDMVRFDKAQAEARDAGLHNIKPINVTAIDNVHKKETAMRMIDVLLGKKDPNNAAAGQLGQAIPMVYMIDSKLYEILPPEYQAKIFIGSHEGALTAAEIKDKWLKTPGGIKETSLQEIARGVMVKQYSNAIEAGEQFKTGSSSIKLNKAEVLKGIDGQLDEASMDKLDAFLALPYGEANDYEIKLNTVSGKEIRLNYVYSGYDMFPSSISKYDVVEGKITAVKYVMTNAEKLDILDKLAALLGEASAIKETILEGIDGTLDEFSLAKLDDFVNLPYSVRNNYQYKFFTTAGDEIRLNYVYTGYNLLPGKISKHTIPVNGEAGIKAIDVKTHGGIKFADIPVEVSSSSIPMELKGITPEFFNKIGFKFVSFGKNISMKDFVAPMGK